MSVSVNQSVSLFVSLHAVSGFPPFPPAPHNLIVCRHRKLNLIAFAIDSTFFYLGAGGEGGREGEKGRGRRNRGRGSVLQCAAVAIE